MKTYNSNLIPRARSMRREMTSAERRLWFYCLRDSAHKFRRQRPIGAYIVDFYCPQLKLVIEVDGNSHYSDRQIEYDRERTQFLESLGLRVLRFTNDEITRQIEEVKMRVFAELGVNISLNS